MRGGTPLTVIDADWTPAERQTRERRAEAYSRRCRRIRRAKSRRATAFVQRLFTGAVLLFGVAVAIALLWG